MLKQRRPTPDLGEPRPVADVLATAARLYLAYPLLFIGLTVIVVVPYELVVLAVAKASPLGQQGASTATLLILELVDFALITPLVSALQVRALAMLGEHELPRLGSVLRRSLAVLPVVAAAEIIAGLAIGAGLLLFLIPGIYLWARFAVVAQVAAIERTDWPGALRRSGNLAAGNYLRILGILLFVLLVNLTLTNVAAAVIGTRTRPAEVAAGIAVAVIERSFQALAIAVLYFDLRAREQHRP